MHSSGCTRRAQSWSDLIDILGRKAKNTDDTDKVIRSSAASASCMIRSCPTRSRPSSATSEILDIDSNNLRAMRSLEDLYAKVQQAEPYLQILETQLDVVGSDDERISLYEKIAVAWENLFKKVDKAAEAHEKALTFSERHFPSYRQLERLYRPQAVG
jgi:hypothetical protein